MRLERELAFQLDDALEALVRGQESLPPVFSRKRDQQRLAPLIETARLIRQTPNPHPPMGAAAASKAHMMQVLIEKAIYGKQTKAEVVDDLGSGLQKEAHGKGIILAVITLVFAFIIVSSLSAAALESLPGSWLYPAKLALQETHILLTFDHELHQRRTEKYYELRMQDLRAAVELKRLTDVEAQATITALPTPHPTATETSVSPH